MPSDIILKDLDTTLQPEVETDEQQNPNMEQELLYSEPMMTSQNCHMRTLK